jgi:proline iminopeptidase
MRVDIGGSRLFFDVEGVGLVAEGSAMVAKPTLLLLHGGPGFDHSLFKPWFGRFSDTHQVVYLDHRGQGRSDDHGDSTHWNLDSWAEDVVAFCAALEIERPVIFGNSFGGMVAAVVGARYPEFPSKLVLSSTAARLHLDALYDMMARLGGIEAREVASSYWTDPTPEHMNAYMEICLPLYTRHGPGPSEARGRAIVNRAVTEHFINGEQRTMDLRDLLADITCQTLMLAGEDDPVCPPVCQEEMVAALSSETTEYHLLPDCGHGTYRDQPELTESILRAFFGS